MLDTENTLPIAEFDNFDIDHPVICVIGKRGSGKSFVIKNLIKKLNKSEQFEDNLLVVSPTEELNPFYSENYPKCKTSYKYDSFVLNEYFYKIKTMRNENREEFNKFSGCVVLDCCLIDIKDHLENPTLAELFYNSRHYNVAVIIITHYPYRFNQDLRSHIDYTFLMYDDGIHNQKQMYKYYAGILPDFATFKPIYKQLTADFGSMVINNKSCDQHLFGKIGWYKAEDRSKLPEPDLNNGDIGNLEDCKISDELRALAILYSFSNLGQGLRYTS